ncbi:MAG: DoxX family protein [Austwickia sp.]|jgi:putative oxidoreductase|nr:MAG: DoxX family protein [Austwickia sp.]
MAQQLSLPDARSEVAPGGLARITGAAPVPAVARDVVLLLARVLLGAIMMAHGWQKLATNGLEATGSSFAAMGVPLPEVSAAVAAVIELGAGAAMVLGLLTPIAGVLLAGVLAGAFAFVHADKGLFVAKGGWELVAALGLAALVFAVVGPGRFSADEVWAGRSRG